VLETAAGVRLADKANQRFDDLDALKGIWSKQDADAFGSATADFAQVAPALWK
jgi:hypothetical protein